MHLKTWVEIETTKGTQFITSYRGQIDTEKLQLYISGQLTDTFIKLERVYWVNDSAQTDPAPIYIAYGSSQTRYYDFVGDIYLKPEHICCISTLHGNEARHLFSESLGH